MPLSGVTSQAKMVWCFMINGAMITNEHHLLNQRGCPTLHPPLQSTVRGANGACFTGSPITEHQTYHDWR